MYESFSFRFTADDDQAILMFRVADNIGASGQFGYLLDNVAVSVVPEPSTQTLGMLALAGFALVAWCKRRRART